MNILDDALISEITDAIHCRSLASLSCHLPNRAALLGWTNALIDTLFPQFSYSSCSEVHQAVAEQAATLFSVISTFKECDALCAESITRNFFARVPDLIETLRADAQALFESDPAAESLTEVYLTYPGLRAITLYRIAHALYVLKVPLLPRLITEYAHTKTGIDIHPGATIGKGCAIDHGTGVVIGATSVVGERVKIYQGVTLGALSVKKSLSSSKRHPTIEDNVILYANATILGGETVIGHDSIIGGNAWVTESVPPHSKIYRREG